MGDNISNFVAERDEVLRSLDLVRLKEFHRKWNPDAAPFPNDEIAERAMHKARTACLTLSDDERNFSRQWLENRRSRSLA